MAKENEAKKVDDDIFGDAKPEHKSSDQVKMASHLLVGMPVHFFQRPDDPYAATVIKKHDGFLVDLVVFRPDNIVSWPKNVVRRGEKFIAGCWDFIS